MFTKSDDSFEIRLRNAEGVPVLQLCGTVTKTASKAVKSTLDRLARAGHYNIVLNVEQAKASNWGFLSGLAGTVRNIRAHYGAVELVAAQDRIEQLLGADAIAKLFRLCRSERQAISRIKRLQRQPDGLSDVNARLLEQS